MSLRVIPRIYQIFEICENEDSFIKWSGKSFQVLAIKYVNEFNPPLVLTQKDHDM
jgi:hypothetical protein